ncbi:PREDICTED: uncharacterized protein LOC100633645 isoform X2 [Amphimedon queenslandica]|uniref:Uncharacterized protein n=1 Tax=Amphimedon queenslandica TaxID=400682 RepID=A0AAN0JCW3_AMPQE|nr:PREDICTED: uncharacterized protein LOC100633645 isoform X2 [Amphimedon queenslandica]|eukprot:XP_019854850.1 PREDICTED: uncharacterized protein LOC100633645 isoform X2 [Amphimedon queenslandica]
MASEKSSLLDRNYSTNSALSVPITSEDPRPLREDASTSVANPFTNKRVGEATSALDSSTIEASTHHQLSSNDPREILFALERAADLLRGQVEEDEQVHRVRKRPLLPVWLTNHLLLITFLIQVVGVGVLEIFHAVSGLDGTNTTEADAIVVDSGDGVLCLIELIHLLVVVVVSFKLVKQVIHHTATGVFLAQCYLSTVLLFAGLYTFEFRISPSAWDNLNANKATHPTFVYLKMLYFSVSTATLCGRQKPPICPGSVA